ncbi:MAG: hypothetical protein L0312_34220 [Acidobacteria bacterium]|nr:hypothetical protein [Acidobacteriota bacterium]
MSQWPLLFVPQSFYVFSCVKEGIALFFEAKFSVETNVHQVAGVKLQCLFHLGTFYPVFFIL